MNSIQPRKLALFALIAAFGVGGVWYLKGRTPLAQADGAEMPNKGKMMPPPTIQAAPAMVADVPVYIDGIGTVVAKNTALVRSRVDGVLQRLHYREGDMVKSGDLLAEIDPRPFQATLAQAKGQLASDEANLANARADLERYRTLITQDSVAQQKVDTQAALVHQLEGSEKADRANVDAAQLQLVYSRITAPIGGRLGLKLTDLGNLVQAASTTGIVVITQVQPIDVVFPIPEDQLGDLLAAQRGGRPIRVEAWDRDMKHRLSVGALLTVDNQIDTTTGTVKIKGEFANADNALFPNQFVNARVEVGTLRHAVEVPAAAVQLGKAGHYVWVLNGDRVALRQVTIGPREGDRTVIASGVALGERVVTDGVDHLNDGMTVKLVSALGDPPAAKPVARHGHKS